MTAAPLTIQVFVPGILTNPMNGSHRHWSARAKWAEDWRTRTQVAWLKAEQPRWDGPAKVTFTACVHRRFDDDNLAACIKPIRDAGVRAILGTDDGPTCGHWFVYKQSVVSGMQRGVLITVEPMSPEGRRGEGMNEASPEVRDMLAAVRALGDLQREQISAYIASLRYQIATLTAENARLRAELGIAGSPPPEGSWTQRLLVAEAENERLRERHEDTLTTLQETAKAAIRAEARNRALAEALGRAQEFIDWKVREWLPSEHTNCGIDSGCAHGAMEREMFQALDDAVDAIKAALTEPMPPQEGGRHE